jgi:glycosyltransferase involved in cell wall biosynthesis
MKVLMIGWEFPPYLVGGLGTHVYNLSINLVRSGVDLSLFAFKPAGSKKIENVEGIKVFRFAYPEMLACCGRRSEIIIENELFSLNILKNIEKTLRLIGCPDILHVHDWMGASLGLVLKEIFQIPLVTTLHVTSKELERLYPLGIYGNLAEKERLLTVKSDRIICCSKAMVNEVKGHYEINPEKIVLIPNGVEIETFQRPSFNNSELSLKHNSGEKAILFVGRLVFEKGILNLIKALPLIIEQIPQAHLLICGKGYLEKKIKEEILRLHIEDKVLLTGFVNRQELADYYALADVAIFPSLYEPFGIVVLEALATKTPVVVSNVGGLMDIIRDGLNGLKVQPGDYEDIARKAILLLKNESYARKLAEQGYQDVINSKNWEQIARETKMVYEEIVRESIC